MSVNKSNTLKFYWIKHPGNNPTRVEFRPVSISREPNQHVIRHIFVDGMEVGEIVAWTYFDEEKGVCVGPTWYKMRLHPGWVTCVRPEWYLLRQEQVPEGDIEMKTVQNMAMAKLRGLM